MSIKELLLTAKSIAFCKQVNKSQESPFWLKSNFNRSTVNQELDRNRFDKIGSIPPYDDPLY